MPRTKVATITIDVFAERGGPISIELRTPAPDGTPRIQRTNVRQADARGALDAERDLRLGLVQALEDALVLAHPLTRR